MILSHREASVAADFRLEVRQRLRRRRGSTKAAPCLTAPFAQWREHRELSQSPTSRERARVEVMAALAAALFDLTSPARRSTCRCSETAGRPTGMSAASSLAVRAPVRSSISNRRRSGWASASNTSGSAGAIEPRNPSEILRRISAANAPAERAREGRRRRANPLVLVISRVLAPARFSAPPLRRLSRRVT